jgi:hypothetical protein
MGVWGQRPQQAMACAAGKGSELASDPCRRHGQKLVNVYILETCNCLANTEKKTYYVISHRTPLSHWSLPENPEISIASELDSYNRCCKRPKFFYHGKCRSRPGHSFLESVFRKGNRLLRLF